MSLDDDAPRFIQDGHKITIAWERDRVGIAFVHCPHSGIEGRGAPCTMLRDYCVVARFIEVYGTELNLGRTVVRGDVDIAWCGLEGESDLDSEFGQIWIVPTDDPDYLSAYGSEEVENAK